MPNGNQEQVSEGEGSGGESDGEEWESDGGEEEFSDDSGDEDEDMEVDLPRCERRSKNAQDPAVERGQSSAPVGQSSKRPRTTSTAPTEKASKQPRATSTKPPKALPKIWVTILVISGAATSETSIQNADDVMEDVVTSNLAPPNIIDLPDDEEAVEVPLRPFGRRGRRAQADKTPQTVSTAEAVVQGGGNTTRTTVTFAEPLTIARPSSSTAPPPVDPPSFFATYQAPEDQVSAAKEAIRQAGLVMEQTKAARDASQAAYDISSALQRNVQNSCELVSCYEDLRQKQIQLDLDLKLAQENLQKARDKQKTKWKKP